MLRSVDARIKPAQPDLKLSKNRSDTSLSMFKVPKWYFRHMLMRDLAAAAFIIGPLYYFFWFRLGWFHWTSLYGSRSLLKHVWLLTRTSYYEFRDDGIALVGTDDPYSTFGRLQWYMAKTQYKAVVRVMPTTLRGHPAVAVSLETGKVIVIPVESEDVPFAVAEIARTYHVPKGGISYVTGSFPGQWPPHPQI